MLSELPDRLIFADVETTGLHSADRIVCLGLVDLNVAALKSGRLAASCTHLIFDPGKKSHPRAEAVHGYDDWTLRHQDQFSAFVTHLRPLFDDLAIVWAHNSAFDQSFFEREFDLAGAPISGSMKCTMQLFRSAYPGERSGLNAALANFDIARSGEKHRALEDAWLAMTLFFAMHNVRLPETPAAAFSPPENFREPPPLLGPLPRRSRKRAGIEKPVLHAAGMADVLGACRATASLMLFVAMADGEIAESEWAAILSLVDETCDRLNVPLSRAQRHDAVASLIDPDTPFSIRSAAMELIADQVAAENIARWIRVVTFADGSGSAPENQAIVAIMEAIRAARAGK